MKNKCCALTCIVLALCLPTHLVGSQGSPQSQNNDVAFTVFVRGSSGEAILQHCKAVENFNSVRGVASSPLAAVDVAFCLGFVGGILDADKVESATLKIGSRYCVPGSVSGAQLARVVVKYGNDHPEVLHLPAVTLVGAAIKGAFAC